MCIKISLPVLVFLLTDDIPELPLNELDRSPYTRVNVMLDYKLKGVL